MSEKATEPSISEKPPDQGLQLQKEISELKNTVDVLKGEVRDRDTEIIGLKKTTEERHSQMEKFSITLGVRNDYATLLGELEKLITVEDDVEILRDQIRTLKNGDNEAIGRVITEGEKAVRRLKEKVIQLGEEIHHLRAKRNVDKYKSMELFGETMKRFFKGIISIITALPRFIISKIKGVKKSGN